MTIGSRTQAELLAAAGRRLSADGYDVIVGPDSTLLPEALRARRPDAIAVGRDPKLVIEIVSERAESAARVATLREALGTAPGWKLHLVLDRASPASTMPTVADDAIDASLRSVLQTATVAPPAALMLAWSALEALVRRRRPETFGRPQSPTRIVEHLAAEGIVLPGDAAFLREMAASRNAVAHGDLQATVDPGAIHRMVALVRDLATSPELVHEQEIANGMSDAPSPGFMGS